MRSAKENPRRRSRTRGERDGITEHDDGNPQGCPCNAAAVIRVGGISRLLHRPPVPAPAKRAESRTAIDRTGEPRKSENLWIREISISMKPTPRTIKSRMIRKSVPLPVRARPAGDGGKFLLRMKKGTTASRKKQYRRDPKNEGNGLSAAPFQTCKKRDCRPKRDRCRIPSL